MTPELQRSIDRANAATRAAAQLGTAGSHEVASYMHDAVVRSIPSTTGSATERELRQKHDLAMRNHTMAITRYARGERGIPIEKQHAAHEANKAAASALINKLTSSGQWL